MEERNFAWNLVFDANQDNVTSFIFRNLKSFSLDESILYTDSEIDILQKIFHNRKQPVFKGNPLERHTQLNKFYKSIIREFKKTNYEKLN